MKRLLLIFILTLNFQTLAKADDIRDFEIEGMSIGDILLDHFQESEVRKIDKFYYPNSKKYFGLASNLFNENLDAYDAVQFIVVPQTYEIISIAGKIYKFTNDKKKCFNEMEKIFNELKLSFPNSKIDKEKESPHDADRSGKSFAKVYKIYLKNGRIAVTCTDWSQDTGRQDSLKVAIHLKDYVDWINNEAYE
tara:strand:- start:163 stop:741 length:579 start_codon:yes stop_codon:yes gene_type:complete